MKRIEHFTAEIRRPFVDGVRKRMPHPTRQHLWCEWPRMTRMDRTEWQRATQQMPLSQIYWGVLTYL